MTKNIPNVAKTKISIRDRIPESKIPKLPYGEGTISYFNDDLLIYKKVIKYGNRKKRESVYGETVQEVLRNMRALENQYREESIAEQKTTLGDAMLEWLQTKKIHSLTSKSYDRVETTIKHQILKYPIGKIRYQEIVPQDISKHIQVLIKDKYSWSTIKKAYDALNEFYRDKKLYGELEKNPMVFIEPPTKENVLVEEKEIEWFDKSDIHKFTIEASKMMKHKNLPKYTLGHFFIAMMYLGLRGGEMIALRWKDIDFNKRCVSVTKSVERIINRDYDESNPQLMKKQGINKYIDKLGLTKNKQSRTVPMNNEAYNALLLHKKYSKSTNDDDLVIPTKSGNYNNLTNMTKRLQTIQRYAETKVQKSGLHVLRHTCASLYFSKNIQVEIIAFILGHSAEVCRRRYIHFSDEQKQDATQQITILDFDVSMLDDERE